MATKYAILRLTPAIAPTVKMMQSGVDVTDNVRNITGMFYKGQIESKGLKFEAEASTESSYLGWLRSGFLGKQEVLVTTNGYSEIKMSTDKGVNWTTMTYPPVSGMFNNFITSNGYWILTINADYSTIYWTKDLTTWHTLQLSYGGSSCPSIVCSDKYLYISVYNSSRKTNYSYAIELTQLDNTTYLYNYVSTYYIVVSNDTALRTSHGTVIIGPNNNYYYFSSNNVDGWVRYSCPTTLYCQAGWVQDDKYYVLACNYSSRCFSTSTDGINWTSTPIPWDDSTDSVSKVIRTSAGIYILPQGEDPWLE